MKLEDVKEFKHINKAYIEFVEGQFITTSAFEFYIACKFMHMEVYVFSPEEVDELEIDENTVVYGGVTTMSSVFAKMGVDVPKPLDIPESLMKFANRKVTFSTIDKVCNDETIQYPVFIKPSDEGKLFNGQVIVHKDEMEMLKVYNKLREKETNGTETDVHVMVSEIVDFKAEFRAFILKGEILDIRKYALIILSTNL